MLSPVEIINYEGSAISYRRIGKGERKILFFHGFPGSSIQVEAFRPLLESKNLQVICVDRPGYNGTDAGSDGQFSRATKTTRAILEKFGWNNFEAVSVSGGTPFLFDFVRSHPELILRVCIISGLGPIGRPNFRELLSWRIKLAIPLIPQIPGHLLKQVIIKSATQQRSERMNLFRFFMPVSKTDKAVMNNLQTRSTLLQGLMEALQQNGIGPKRDLEAFLNYRELNLGKYSGEIKIWHGSDDQILPLEMAKLVAAELPSAQLTVVPNEGHYSLIIDRIAEII